MPIQRCTLPSGKTGFKWGQHGHCYPSREGAEKQAAAAHAHGFVGDSAKLVAPGKSVTLKPVRPNAGLRAKLQKQILAIVDEMNASTLYWLSAAYKANEPLMAADALPAKALQKRLRELAAQWLDKFSKSSRKIAEAAVAANKAYSDSTLKAALKDAGFTVEFKVTKIMQDALDASVVEHVGLIKSIASRQLEQVETIVMQSVQNGRDLQYLTDSLQKQFGVTRRRAILIARDQNNKATAVITRVRQKELGITQAIWMHSHAGKVPRPSHVAADGHLYDIDKGLYLDGEWVWPGTAINCLPGDSVIEFAAGCKKLWRRRYDGKLAFFVTESGKTIKATPNHPVLTNRGWIPIKEVCAGDDVIGISEQVTNGIKINVNSDETTFAQIFDTVASHIIPAYKACASFAQFHGDISDGEIEAIDIDCFLPNKIDPAQCKKIAELLFANTDHLLIGAGFQPNSALLSACYRLFRAPESIIRGFSALLPLIRRHLAHTDDIRFGAIPEINSLFDQMLTDGGSRCSILFGECKDAESSGIVNCDLFIGKLFNVMCRASWLWDCESPSAESLGKSALGDSNSGSSIFNGISGFNERERVIQSGVTDFCDHVYNLENGVNWYSSQYLIIHNCRCFSRSIIPGLAD